ncbi:MAG: Lrp/AsnC family transcriptional regulator [Paracoccus sp. (in: a-proteobacteria)]|uniref:Lrp/AsnC family transcriptional regulator n=1 Tax=Paracoccus sp. TaxID=267 RepID=UPI0026DFA54A|nr:Lrp/AsnC family transcriptional regulator [Paracoccus sp. (in: a-proteobacteria)]MDO5630682.1 Lrp/AsnC family transcriptional regulator [Paracoccus sp. (in: a-proteobacteria)]
MQIDRTNRRILALLRKDARISAAAIGREIGLSRPAVQARVAALEQAGVITGYHAAITDQPAQVHALLFVQIAVRPCDRALNWLMTLQGVESVVSLAGDIDAVMSVRLPGTAELSALNDLLAASGLIAGHKSQVVLRRYGAP